jgi:predicted DCC family thiol-disulfide oxidoreductase YuxK
LTSTSEFPVLFFDGVCNLCNKTVQFIIRKDKWKIFRFAALQTSTGQGLLERIKEEKGFRPDSVILLYKDKYYLESDAALKVAGLLGGAWKLGMAGYILPRFLRNALYRLIAKRRYKWFGKQDECMIPTPELKARFIDS